MSKIALISALIVFPSLFFAQERTSNELNTNTPKDTTSSYSTGTSIESKDPENFGYTKTTTASGKVIYYKKNNNLSIIYKPKQ